MRIRRRAQLVASVIPMAVVLTIEGVFVQKSQPRRRWIKREFGIVKKFYANEWKNAK